MLRYASVFVAICLCLLRYGPDVASTLVERGYENVSLLTGGLEAVHRKYPKSLFCGRWPSELFLDPPQSSETSKKTQRSRSVGPPAEETTEMKDSFTEEDLETLREELEWNRLPPYAKSNL